MYPYLPLDASWEELLRSGAFILVAAYAALVVVYTFVECVCVRPGPELAETVPVRADAADLAEAARPPAPRFPPVRRRSPSRRRSRAAGPRPPAA